MRPLAVLAVFQMSAAALHAQSTLQGTVRDQVTGRPLAGVQLRVENIRREALTDSGGRYVLAGLPTGRVTLAVRRAGYTPRELTLELSAGDQERDLSMVPVPASVDSIAVSADRPRLSPAMAGFQERRGRGLGTFIDYDALRIREHSPLTEVLRGINGLRFRRVGSSSHIAVNPRKNNCPYAVILNGVPIYRPSTGGIVSKNFPPPDLEEFPVNVLEAVEVYSGPGQTPAEFSWTGSDCGVLVLHTRER